MNQLSNYLSIFSVLLPLSVGIIRYKYLEANARVLLLMVAFASIPQLFSLYRQLPVPYYNSYIFVEVVLWPVIYFLSSENRGLRKVFLLLLALNLFIDIYFLSARSFTSRFYYELVCIDSLFQVIYVSLFFYEVNLRNEYVQLKKLPLFWFSIGILFYAPCTFFVFLFYFKISKTYGGGHLNYLHRIHDFFNVLMYVLFTAGLLIKRRNPNV